GRIVKLFHPRVTAYYTPHGYSFLMEHKPMGIRILYWLVEWLLSQINCHIVACSKSEFRYAKKLSPFRKVYLLENCISPRKNHSPKIGVSPTLIIGVGRMDEQKNPQLFIRVAARLKKLKPDIQAVWVGDGILRRD